MQGSASPHLGTSSQSKKASPPAVGAGGATRTPDKANYCLDQINFSAELAQSNFSAELAQGNAMGSDECFENVFPNKTSREQTMVTQPTSTRHLAQQPGPEEVMQSPTDNLPHHSGSGSWTEGSAQGLMEGDTSTYTLYVDVVGDKWSSLFYDTIKELQEAYAVAYPQGTAVPVRDLSIPIASFKPKILEDLVDLGAVLDKEIHEFVQTQQMFAGVLLTYNRLDLTSAGNVETEVLIGRDRIQELKRRIHAMKVEDTLPIDFNPHTLRIFQGCEPAQGVRKNMKGMKEHLFLGAVSAASATLRMDDQGATRSVQGRRVVLPSP